MWNSSGIDLTLLRPEVVLCMSGFITTQTVQENRDLILSLYGMEVYQRCMVAQSNETFLGILIEMGKI